MKEFIRMVLPQTVTILVIFVLVLMVVFLDLWAGIRKAKQRGEYRSSYGLRKTVDKIVKYYNMMLVVAVIDFLQFIIAWELNGQSGMHIPILPILTLLGGIFISFIELKSIWEKNSKKERAKAQEAAELLMKLSKNEGVVQALMQYLKENEERIRNDKERDYNKAEGLL